MKAEKKLELVLNLDTTRDRKIYCDIQAFAKKHGIEDESDALKSFMMHLHFLAVDMNTLARKIQDLHEVS
jgi:hypothetical protein